MKIDYKKLRTLGIQSVLIRREDPEVITEGGIIVPNPKKNPPNRGVVISLSEKIAEKDKVCEPGDIVRFALTAGVDLEDKENNVQYVIIDQNEILCIEKDLEAEKWEDRISIPSNYVLVDIDWELDGVNKIPGSKMLVSGREEREKHAPTQARVLLMCDKLNYYGHYIKKHQKTISSATKGTLMRGSTNFKTKIEVKKGDNIHFHYLQIMISEPEARYIEIYNKKTIKKDKYYFIRYDMLFCVENQLKNKANFVKPVNGFVFIDIEDIEEEKTKSGLVGINMGDEKKWGIGTVKYLSKYLIDDYLENFGVVDERAVNISIGDKVQFRKLKRSNAGYSLYLKESNLKNLFRIQRKDIHRVIKN